MPPQDAPQRLAKATGGARIPLIDPSVLLDALLSLVRPLFHRFSFIVSLLLVGLAILLGLQHQTDLAALALFLWLSVQLST